MSAKTDLAHAILKILRPAQDLDLHPHEVDRQIPAIELGKADRVFLSSQDDLGLPLLAAVDDVQDFLLREAVVVRKALGVDQLASEVDEALLKTLRLRNPAQGRDFLVLQEVQSLPLAG